MSALPDAATADAPDRRTLAHAGVADAGRVQTLLTSPEFEGVDVRPLVELLGHAADPDRALLLWVRLAEREPRVHHALRDPETTARLLRLLGASEALGEFLIRRPEQLDLVLDPDAAAATDYVLRLTTRLVTGMVVDAAGTTVSATMREAIRQ